MTSIWNSVPGNATRFDGRPITTVPDVGSYFGDDVIPVLETQQRHFNALAATSKIDFIGPLVLVIGLIVIAFGLLMVLLAAKMPSGAGAKAAPKEAPAASRT